MGEGRIGGNDSFNGGFWHGLIDEVAVFSRALTEAEVTQLFETTRHTSEPAVVAPLPQPVVSAVIKYVSITSLDVPTEAASEYNLTRAEIKLVSSS